MSEHTFSTNLVCFSRIIGWASFLDSLAINYGAELQDSTDIGDGTRIMVPGLRTVTLSMSGFWEVARDATIIQQAFDQRDNQAVTIVKPGSVGVAGDPAYCLEAVYSEYNIGGAVGDVMPFEVTMQGNDLGDGTILANGSWSSDSAGSHYQLGAVDSANKEMIVTVHLSAMSGFSGVDFEVYSDSDPAFLTPSLRQTVSFTGVESVAARVTYDASKSTEDYWAVTVNVTGTGSATAVVAASIITKA